MPFWNPGDEITADKLNKAITIQDFVLGESVNVNDAVCFSTADGKVWKAKASYDERAFNFIGFAKRAGNANDIIEVQLSGIVSGFSGLTPGRLVYLSNTPGAISLTPETYEKVIGFVRSSTEILLIPNTEFQMYLAPGEVLSVAADTERSTNSTAQWIKFKEIKLILGRGKLRVRFDWKGGVSGYPVYAQIWKNGSAYGTQVYYYSSDWATYTEDLDFEENDLIQLYGRVYNSSYPVYVRNFRIYNVFNRAQHFQVIQD